MNQLWDIRQPVRTSAEDIVRIRYKETTSEDVEDFMYAAITVIFGVCKASEAVIVTCSYELCV
jgi:hypothetical protein